MYSDCNDYSGFIPQCNYMNNLFKACVSVSGGVLEKFILRKAQTGIKAEATSLSLDSCVIENSVTSGIDATLTANQTLRVQNCSIGSNGRHGVYAKGTSGTYEVDFNHSMFTNNKNTGVLIERGDVRLRLVDCGFKDNYYQNLKASPNSGLVEVHESYFGKTAYRYSRWTAQISMSGYNGDKASKAVTGSAVTGSAVKK